MTNIGKKIADHLSGQGLSQRELAQRVGVSEVAMSRYINGTRIPKATILDSIAKTLHTSMEELMGQMKDDPEKCYYRVQQEIYQFKDSWSDQQKLNLIAILSTFLKSPAGRSDKRRIAMTTINAKLEEKCIVDMEGDGREVVELIAAIVHSLALNMGVDYRKVMNDIYGVLERDERAGILDTAYLKVERGGRNG